MEDSKEYWEEKAEQEEKETLVFDESVVILFIMLVIYVAFSSIKDAKELSFGHQASLVTLIGFGISYAYQAAGNHEFADLM